MKQKKMCQIAAKKKNITHTQQNSRRRRDGFLVIKASFSTGKMLKVNTLLFSSDEKDERKKNVVGKKKTTEKKEADFWCRLYDVILIDFVIQRDFKSNSQKKKKTGNRNVYN